MEEVLSQVEVKEEKKDSPTSNTKTIVNYQMNS
jgi:hypothetical protein